MIAKPIVLASLCLLCACAPPPTSSADTADPVRTDASGRTAGHIAIPASLRRNLGLTFAAVELRRVAQTIRVPGAFELEPLARHEYRMALPGRIELRVDQYDRVEAGQVLYRFQSPTWPELLHEIILGEQAIETARAEIEVGEARILEVQRKLELTRERIEALAGADFKRADLEMGAAELEASLPRIEAEIRLAGTHMANAERTRGHALHRAATASGIGEKELEREVLVGESRLPLYLTLDWIEVLAAEAGIVDMLYVTDGAFAETPAPVVSTVDPERVRFRALGLQADLPRLLSANEARIVPPRSPGYRIEEGVPAELELGLEAHPEERTLTVFARPRELAPWIRPGVSAFLEIVVDTTALPMLAIPSSALVKDGSTYVFFRRDPKDPDAVLRVEADLGVNDGRWVAVESGLGRGDEVVLAGAYELKLALDQAGAPEDAGAHVHADGTVHDDH